jgi:hypothetical protein
VGNLLFPKEPNIPSRDQSWSQQVYQGGDDPGRFSLVLLLVNRKGQREIAKWLRAGEAGAGYPGFTVIPGSAKLDTVTDLAL